jgi:hypothetical protein
MWLPTVAVFSDGVWLADGRDGESDEPQVLTGLAVRWGRSTVVDQPQPSTCTLTIEDREGGSRFLDQLRVGGRQDVKADALLPDDGGGSGERKIVIEERFTAGPGNAYRLTGSATLTATAGVLEVDVTAPTLTTIVVPPAPLQPTGGDPGAWDDVPRSLTGQVWEASIRVRVPPPFAGYAGWAAVLRPVTYDTPWATPVLLDPIATGNPSGANWTEFTGSFVPPANVWLGVAVELFPTGPTWDDLPAAPVAGVQRTNRTFNPRAVATGAASWPSTRGFGVGGAGSYSFLTGATPEPVPGVSTARRKTWTTASTNTQDSGFIFQNDAASYIPVTAGERVTVSAYVRHSSATSKLFRMRLLWHATAAYGSTYNGLVESADYVVAGGTGWTRITMTGTVPAGNAGLEVIADVMPGSAGNWAVGNTLDATAVLIEPVSPTGPDSYFDGDLTDVPGVIQFDWTGAVAGSTSTTKAFGVAWDALDPTVTWDSLGRFGLDDVLLTAPAGGTGRLGMVFSGRITDLEARYDEGAGATLVEVTAADQRAELGNRDVGDYPWNEETLGARFARIIARSGQPIETRVSASAAKYLVSWRDVDRQPAMLLLDELATSSDAVLWAATHPTTGPYLELESMSDRVALFVLEKSSGDGLIRIVLKPTDQTGAVEIDACSILLDPVRWRHDIEDIATRVAVTWREQFVDPDDGLIKPKDVTETLENPSLEADIGVRRIAVATQLSRQADAQNIAGAILGRTGVSQWRVSGLEWHVNQNDDQFDADQLTVLMKLLDGTSRNGLPLILSNLPAWSPILGTDRVPLFLEGGRYINEDGAWELDLIVSSATSVGDSVTWDELPPNPGWSWDDFAPEVRWIDMGGVSAPR